ncbi:Hypothetical predicted protein [Olea europaea subsp. europaea]|uniref:Uncharacterized protein n=1 Tax=Olea europaea subsp. europaea TaxID=158383 RepID=A0A8S0SK91_OLEEU|nr:Hypothetical predicted protein [Olea europaea subsp. europaea]
MGRLQADVGDLAGRQYDNRPQEKRVDKGTDQHSHQADHNEIPFIEVINKKKGMHHRHIQGKITLAPMMEKDGNQVAKMGTIVH